MRSSEYKHPTTIIVLSDTHLRRSIQELPEEVISSIKEADMVIHAGDLCEIGFLNELKQMKKTVAVSGNMDSQDVRNVLKPKEIVRIGKYKIGVIHGSGSPGGLVEQVRNEFGDVNAIVFGHAHTSTNMTKDNVLFFNPGSPTDKVFATVNSYGRLTVSDKGIQGEIIQIGERTK